MKHSLQIEGFNLRLRPVRLDDAAFIVWLRHLDHVKGRVGDSAHDAPAQEAWLEKYFEREGDYYFIVETQGGISLGTHAIYEVRGASAEQGRNIVRPEVLAGAPVGILGTNLAFDMLGLSEIRASVVSTNRQVLSLHRKAGFKQGEILRAAQTIGDQPVDLIQFFLKAEDWPKAREVMLPLAELAGRLVLDWDKSQTGQRQPWETAKI